MMLLPIALALIAGGEPPRPSIPDTIPIYCYSQADTYDPMVGTDFGALRAAVLARYNLRPHITVLSDTGGTLQFGDDGREETLTFGIQTHDGVRGPGMTLMYMRSGNHELGNLDGFKLCWTIFGMVHDR